MTTKEKKNGKVTTTNRLPKPEVQELKIQPLNIGRLTLRLRGTSPLVVHAFGAKARLQMLEKQMATGKAAREPRCPVEEFLDCFYHLDGKMPVPKIDDVTKEKTFDEKEVADFCRNTTFLLPITGFKNAMISACRNTDFTMTQMKQSIRLSGPDHHDWAVINGDVKCRTERLCLPVMREDIVRLAGAARTPMVRFRPMWEKWETTINVDYDANQFTKDQIGNIVAIAGFYVGVFEGRPERSSLGWGTFELV